MISQNSRTLIDRLLERGESSSALHQMREMFREHPASSTAQFVLDRLRRLPWPMPRSTCRVAFLRSFTLEPVIPLLQAGAALNGIEVQTWMGGFNTWAQELLEADSGLYGFGPDVVILAVLTRDIAPGLWSRSADLSSDDIQAEVERTIHHFRSSIAAFTTRSQASLIVQGLELPVWPAGGILEDTAAAKQVSAIHAINTAIRQIANAAPGVCWLDYDRAIAFSGRQRWYDESKWLTARMPISAECLPALAREYLRFLHPLTGKIAKVIVVDLDNTLWGGVAGEDGVVGIQCGAEYPGACYRAVQLALRDLKARGLLLAVCSKNNASDAMEVLESHPDMLLRPADFAVLRLGWEDKAQGLLRIAEELQIGTDTLAFLDDNPAERMRVAQELPEVHVIDLPERPMEYARVIRECPLFERLALTREDGDRTRYYREQQQRETVRRGAATIENFLRSLEMEMEIRAADEAVLPRVAQLVLKTNQFNLTTHRHSEPALRALLMQPDSEVLTVRIRDRFGDNGIVGAAITHQRGDTVEIDTFLLSCRVIGRTIETAVLADLVGRAALRGARTLRGWFIPTKKNTPARDFYRSHGFIETDRAQDSVLWEIAVASAQIRCPEWIRSREPITESMS